MTIKLRLILLALAVAGAFLLQTLFFTYSINSLGKLNHAQFNIEHVESEVLALRKHEKDFLARKDMEYKGKFLQDYQVLETALGELTANLESLSIDAAKASVIAKVLVEYREQFLNLITVQQKIGLNEKDGLYGALRDAVHAAEKSINEVGNDKLLAAMLMLRRNEKDFMLRSNLRYQEKFEKNFGKMMTILDTTDGISAARKQQIRKHMDKYRNDFTALVEGYKEKGLDSGQGLLGSLRNTVHKTEGVLTAFSTELKTEVGARTDSVVWQGYGMVALFVPLMLIYMLRNCTNISRPLDHMMHIVSKIHNDHDLTQRVETKGNDEISKMGKHLNAMLEDFQRIIQEVARSVSTLAAASTELSAVTEQTSTGMQQQNNETKQVAEILQQLMSSVNKIVSNTNDAMNHAEQVNQLAQDGDHAAHETSMVIDSLASSVIKASDVIARLQKDSDEIGTIVDVINSIAEQTNLLALNASIEAARAGEQGRGFAVVADEVRSLASRTQQSTQEIAQMVERLQNASRDAVDAMASGKDLAENGVANTTSTRGTIANISKSIETINRMAKDIAGATREQSSMADKVGHNMGVITRITTETTDSGVHITRSAQELSQTATELQAMVECFTY